MTLGQTAASFLVASAGLAAPNFDLQLAGMGLAGATIGGYIAASGWRKQESPVTFRRFLVNAGCGLCFCLPFTRLVCGWLGWEVTWECVLAGGCAMGVFGVVLLDIGPAFLLDLIKKKFNLS